MTIEEKQEISRMIYEAIISHNHDGVTSLRLQGKYLQKAPQTALTSELGGSLSTGGVAVLSTSDSNIIANAVTRIVEIETKLRAVGVIK
jgi:hypothetical protein